MRRRDTLRALAALGAFPALARAQGASRTVRIGWLIVIPAQAAPLPAPFLERMRQLGYEPGRNLHIEARYADNDLARLPALARELVASKPDLLVSGSQQATAALKEATSSIPIVFRSSIDPVASGLVASLARPDGNVTGVFQLGADLFGKRFELLRELAPQARRVAVLAQASEKPYVPMMLDLAARTRFELIGLWADDPDEIRRAIGSASAQRLEGFIIGSGPVNNTYRAVITDAIARTRLPAVYPEVPFADAGGIVAYAADLRAGFIRLAEYADRVLKGAKPTDLPAEQSREVLLVLNLKAARAQGIAVPQSLLVRATRVIE